MGKAIKEVRRFDPDEVVGCYSRSKAMASQAVLDAVREAGTGYPEAYGPSDVY